MTQAGVKNKGGRPRLVGKSTGLHRARSANKAAYEAFIDYLLQYIGVDNKSRGVYVAHLAERGTDVPAVRHVDAPKPIFGPTHTFKSPEHWLIHNLRAKGWDREGPPFEIKSHALTHGGRLFRRILPLRQLIMSVEFLASRSVSATLKGGR